MKNLNIIFTALFIFILAACGSSEGDNNSMQFNDEDIDSIRTESDVTEGDFTYRLYVAKGSYQENDDIQITAELTYIGELDEVTISHAASPFYFNMKELERGYDIPYGMNEPHILTTLKKGEPIVETYNGGGGYSEEDDKEYIEFMKQMMRKYFPKGHYVVNGVADFHDDTNEEKYNIQGQIQFVVE